MPLQEEAVELVSCGIDMFGRDQRMTPHTFGQWREMRSAAQKDGIELLIVSAFRPVDYQCDLIRAKLAEGQLIDDILKVNAAPGYSEHHSGRAVDLSTSGCEPLSEEFEYSAAYHWLTEHAGNFEFHLSYPRDNSFGIVFEPWHWACES